MVFINQAIDTLYNSGSVAERKNKQTKKTTGIKQFNNPLLLGKRKAASAFQQPT